MATKPNPQRTTITSGPWKSPDQDWQTFLRQHQSWAEQHVSPDGVLYGLPPRESADWSRLYMLTAMEAAAEAALTDLCGRHDALGWTRCGPIRYGLLSPPKPFPIWSEEMLSPLLKLGWTQEDVDFVSSGRLPHRSVLDRWPAAAGRLIAMKAFLDDRDALREKWLALDEASRPPLPLPKSAKLAQQLSQSDVPAPPVEAAFWHSFDEFCRRWQLLGMATWELPEPAGPQWPNPIGGDVQDVVRLETPWHFPLQERDDVGAMAGAAHADASAEHGVDDHMSWATYATFLPLAHWELVLASRYPKEKRAQRFMTELEFVLAELLGLKIESLQKRRKQLKGLWAGRFSSLRGRR